MKYIVLSIVCGSLLVSCAQDASGTTAVKQVKPTRAVIRRDIPEYATETTKLATIAVPYGIPAGSHDCRPDGSGNVARDGIRITIAPNGKSVAYVGCEQDDTKFVFARGMLSRGLKKVLGPIFSADGKHVAYIREGDAWTVSIDGNESLLTSRPSGAPDRMGFSPDGKFFYQIHDPETEGYTLYIDRERQPYTGTMFTPVFANGSVAYRITEYDNDEPEVSVMMNGKRGKSYAMVTQPVLSPDGKRIAYIAVTNMSEENWENIKCVIVIDEKETPYNCEDHATLYAIMFDTPPVITFSPDSSSVAYRVIVEKGEYTSEGMQLIPVRAPKTAISVNGKLGNMHEGTIYHPTFHPFDGTVAYVVYNMDHSSAFVVHDGKKGKAYEEVSLDEERRLRFTPDGTKLVYVGERDKKNMIIINDEEGPAYDDIHRVSVSPDGSKIGYVASKLVRETEYSFISHYVAVIDGHEEGDYFHITSDIIFSNDNRHTAYSATSAEGSFMILNGVTHGMEYDEILTSPVFTAESKLAYGARKGNDIWWITDLPPSSP